MTSLNQAILEMPGVDIHSHLRGKHTEAHDLGEIFFYHVAAQAMVAAGMPPDLMKPERPVDERIKDALPYMAKIRNTTMFWVIKEALRVIHGFDAEDFSWANWEGLCRKVEATSGQPGWAREVLCNKAKLNLSITSTPRGRGDIADDQRDFLDYTCEQPVTHADIMGYLERSKEPITTTAALNEALEAHLAHELDEHDAGSFTYWPQRGFACPPEEAPNVDAILAARAKAKASGVAQAHALQPEQIRALDDAVAHRALPIINERGLPFVMCIGITMNAHGRTLLRYDAAEAGEIFNMMLRYPRINYFLMAGNVAQSHELNTIAKQMPNAYMACSWWHGMYPQYAERELAERLEMIPCNRLVAVITDAYSAEWSVARSLLSRLVLARVLEQKVAAGEYTEAFALEIAQAMLEGNAREVFAR